MKGIYRALPYRVCALEKSPKRRNKAQRKVDYKNYDAIIMSENFTGNYDRKLSASIYHHAKNEGIIGILAYPKIKQKREERKSKFL